MINFDEVFDFVVVGSGGGSMCAACSGGVMWIPNNRFMKRDHVEDSFEKAATYLDAVSGNGVEAPGYARAAPQISR
jgi:3-oxosteroid 1-dehydrogenase